MFTQNILAAYNQNDVLSQSELLRILTPNNIEAVRMAARRDRKSGKLKTVPGEEPKDVQYEIGHFSEWAVRKGYIEAIAPADKKLTDATCEETAGMPHNSVVEALLPSDVHEVVTTEALSLDFEVDVASSPNPTALEENRALETNISDAEMLKLSLSDQSSEQLEETLKSQNALVDENAAEIIKSSMLMVVAAWLSGMVLHQIKAKCRHGAFGPKLKELASANNTSVRSLQRYMQIAALAPEIRPLLDNSTSLRTAFAYLRIAGFDSDETIDSDNEQGTGELKPDSGQSGSGCTEPKVLKSALSFQKILRQFKQSGGQFEADSISQLKHIVGEIREFIDAHEATKTAEDHAA